MAHIKKETERWREGGLKKWTNLIGPYQERDREKEGRGLKKWTNPIGPHQERDREREGGKGG